MATACVHNRIYVGLSYVFGVKQFCTFRAVPYADMADVDAVCSVWDTDSEDECESEEMVADGAGAGGGSLFGLELV